MFTFEDYEGSYCEGCLDSLTQTERRRTKDEASLPYCDDCIVKTETPENWDVIFLDLLAGLR